MCAYEFRIIKAVVSAGSVCETQKLTENDGHENDGPTLQGIKLLLLFTQLH